MADDAFTALLQQYYGTPDPRAAYRDPTVDLGDRSTAFPSLPPLPPRAELRNPGPRPADAMAPVSDALAPFPAAYGMGQSAAETYLRGRSGDYAGAAESALPLGLAALPIPGAKRLPIGRFTDKEGYTVQVVPRAPSVDYGDPYRKGHTTIVDPTGKEVRAGYWMDYPEPHWTHNGTQLLDDWVKNRDQSVWASLPLEKRLAMEAEQQATAYAPLRDQFAEHATPERQELRHKLNRSIGIVDRSMEPEAQRILREAYGEPQMSLPAKVDPQGWKASVEEPAFRKLMGQEYAKAKAGDDYSTMYDILGARLYRDRNMPPPMRQAMELEMEHIKHVLGPEWLAKYGQ